MVGTALVRDTSYTTYLLSTYLLTCLLAYLLTHLLTCRPGGQVLPHAARVHPRQGGRTAHLLPLESHQSDARRGGRAVLVRQREAPHVTAPLTSDVNCLASRG